MQTTSGNDSRTGSRRAAASPARRRAALASSPRRSRTGASGRPSRTAAPSADTNGRALRPHSALSSAERVGKPGAAMEAQVRRLEARANRRRRNPRQLADRLRRRQASVQAHDHQLDGVGHRRVDRLLRRVSPAAPAQQHDPDDGAADDDGDSRSESTDTADRKRRDGEDAPTSGGAAHRRRRSPSRQGAHRPAAQPRSGQDDRRRRGQPRGDPRTGHRGRPMIRRIHSEPRPFSTAPSITTAAPAGVTTAVRTVASVVASSASRAIGMSVSTRADSRA